MPPSLTLKLQRGCDSLSTDQIKRITRALPTQADGLAGILTESQLLTTSEDVLRITRAHERDQERFDECVLELRAFSSGGLYAMELLNNVYPNILTHYGMQGEKWEVLTAAGIGIDFKNGRLKVDH
jgi:hypothetical protein